MSTSAKDSLAQIAMALREEQLQAKVVHYKAELETSPELDAVTAQVVAELGMLQQALRQQSPPSQKAPDQDRAQLEIQLIESLKTQLGRMFRPDKLASSVQRKLAEVAKRFARLFFESELHDKLRGGKGEAKVMRHPEQALFHMLQRNQDYLARQLDQFEYADAEVKKDTRAVLDSYIKELRNDFLGRSTPELNALVRILNEVLTRFFLQELPPVVGELAWEVVKEARLADSKMRAGYKLSAEAFPRFRQAFEKRFLQRLVPFSADEMLKRVQASSAAGEGSRQFRIETLKFVADPHIYSDVCELVCESVYDYLYNDGFLDLPADWRARLVGG
jgi:hypothetical protein